MFGMTLTPEAVNIALPSLFLASYLGLRKYRDPIRCDSGCLHVEGCVYYVPSPYDPRIRPRKDASEAVVDAVSLVVETEAKRSPAYSIYTALKPVMMITTLIPAVIFSAYKLRKIRLGYEACYCRHAPFCALGVETYSAPPGCEGWTLSGKEYNSPDGKRWLPGIRVLPSSARALFAKKERIKRGRSGGKMFRRSV